MKLKRWMTLALSGVLAAGTLGYASVPAKADVAYSTEYEITIPSTLEVQNAGWNATTGITAKLGNGEAFDSSKKLTVTAASAHGWTLVSDNNTVGYNLATEGNNDSAYNAQAEVPSWEFAADEITTAGKNKAMGIIVEDYSNKPAGTYQDTVTFTAKVEDAAPATITVTINQSDWGSGFVQSFTKDGVTVSAGFIDTEDGNIMDGGTFSTTLGNFTEIVVTTTNCNASGTGWSGSGSSMTWAGTPASTVSFSGEFMGRRRTQTTIVCTIEPTN